MKKSLALILLLCILLGLSSCGSSPAPELIYNKQSIALSEPNDTFSRKDDMELTSVDGVTYAFEEEILPEDRTDCIEKTQSILKRIGYNKEIHVYIYTESTYDSTYISGGSVYTHVQPWESPEYISYLLSGLFGEYCNYGAVYGYADYICRQINKSAADENGFSLEGGDYSALDLNILCFNQDFVSQKDIDNSKKVSAAFVSDYIDAHGIDKFHKLLISSGTVEGADIFSRELSQFYAKNNIDYLPSTVLYALGGHSYDYIAKCRYAEFYIENGWYDENNKLNLLTYENFLHQNYADVKKFFEINSEQMGKYQLLLGFEEYNNDLKVYFSNSKRLSQYSFYQRGKHSIYLMNVDSLMHEYIHSVTVENNPSDSGWSVEGAARYFSYKYDYYGIAMLNADYNKPSSGKETLYVQEYKEKIGRDINMETDFTEIENIAVYSRSYYDPNCSYVAGSSFVAYMVSQLGEDEVIDMIFSEQGVEQSMYEEMVDDWTSYIKANYGDYSKYE